MDDEELTPFGGDTFFDASEDLEESESDQETYRFDQLNKTDYSLNSPLIVDDVQSYVAKRKGLPHELHTSSYSWDIRDRYLDFHNHDLGSVHDPSLNHCWWGRVNQFPVDQTPLMDKLLLDTAVDHRETHPVIKSFFAGWLNEDTEDLSQEIIGTPREIRRYGELALVLHYLIIALNSVTISELDNIRRKFRLKITTENNVIIGARLNLPIFGKTHVFGGLIWFEDQNIVIDRNFALMMKDTYFGRFQTLFGMHCRRVNPHPVEELHELLDIYEAGDFLLEMNGSDGYDAIKLLEPCCNLRFCEKAREERPLVPEFESFKHHINNSKDDVKHMYGASVFLNLILQIQSLSLLTVVYGSFRHWGHPYIDYMTGLRKLHDQVNMPKTIDSDYAEALASDLAYLVLKKKFSEHKKWFVDDSLVPKNHMLLPHIKNNTWPTPKQIEDFGDKWHTLPLVKCFEIPDVIDPSNLYSDKSHSIGRSEVIEYVKSGKCGPIPTRKVLDTLLHTPSTNWPGFLEKVDREGLDEEDLVIGLKAKEREVKKYGRFFALMSWALREYFVITEYLIKTHYVPLFSGLTMADDLTTVISKLLDRTQGQGGIDYDNICIANHIDYEKWNNHQRLESTGPVFRVMGQFLGYPNLIWRTHEFFEKSLVYYNGRPDLMEVHNGKLLSKDHSMVCWQGQKGGLEGQRQKGWSILSLLVIQRESLIRNTKVKVLAQGDNQVICTQYKLRDTHDTTSTLKCLDEVVKNNDIIMKAIKTGTNKLGLIINEDETMQSSDYLNYGKIPIYRGRILNLYTKRLSRVMCTTNDQLPTMSNIMATVSTNTLTIAHFDETPINAIYYFDILSNMTRNILESHNVILGSRVRDFLPSKFLKRRSYKILMNYLDPSLGGACGTSLARFLTRMFPDPVTEGLSFWKCVWANTTDALLSDIAKHAGNPQLSTLHDGGFEKLLENPSSLNIPKGLSLTNVLKEEIKKCLLKEAPNLRNEIVRIAAEHCLMEEDRLMGFLESVDPLFPRFLSEFRAATFFGITDSLIGLFQNARTIRSIFSKRLERDLSHLTQKSEIESYRAVACELTEGRMWDCSAEHADLLRRISWGRPVLGATVPHPLEMFSKSMKVDRGCPMCIEGQDNDFIVTIAPLGLSSYGKRKGPYPAYLGSKTSESTSIIQPWERETNVPVIKRASRMRTAINWFVESGSNLGVSILSILKGLTGEDWEQKTEGFRRTGSALHRFSCSRTSAGGYAALAPTLLSWMITTTDTFEIIGSDNYDFMFQPSILYGQVYTACKYRNQGGGITVHHHLGCKLCLRRIEEPTLDSSRTYEHPDVSHILAKWKPDNTQWGQNKEIYKLNEIEGKDISPFELSFQIGRAEGFLFGDMLLSENKHMDDSSLFPLTLQYKLNPKAFYEGLLDGLLRAVSLTIIHRRSVAQMRRPRPTLVGGMIHCIDAITQRPPFLNMIRDGPLHYYLMSEPHRVPASYPISDSDMGSIVRSWLKRTFFRLEQKTVNYSPLVNRLCIFADMTAPEIIGPLVLSSAILPLLFHVTLNKNQLSDLRELRDLSAVVRDIYNPARAQIGSKNAILCKEEIRHALKYNYKKTESNPPLIWGTEYLSYINYFQVLPQNKPVTVVNPIVGQHRCPLISGLRIGQLATGAHYKIRTIVARFGLNYRDFLCGGDGSGGMTAALLRFNQTARGIFNSLLEYEKSSSRGSKPGPPPAITACTHVVNRCVNYLTTWSEPSDLSKESTWENFSFHVQRNFLKIDLMVFDMEVRELIMSANIESLIESKGLDILELNGNLVYKTYLTRHLDGKIPVIERLGKYFHSTYVTQTGLSSSRTSEIYVVFLRKRDRALYQPYDWNHFWLSSQKFAALCSEKDEFDRALKISPQELTEGIPDVLFPDLEVELCTLLGILGVHDGTSSQLARELKFVPSGLKASVLWAILLVSLNNIFDVTSEHTSIIGIPSDPSCEKAVTLLLGFFYWFSWLTRDLPLFKYLNKINDDQCPISFNRLHIERGNKIGHVLSWSCSRKGQVAKSVNTASLQAGIGKIIRLFSQSTYEKQSINWKLVWAITHRFNKSLNSTLIKERTGIWEMWNRCRLYEGSVKHLKTSSDEENTSWRS
nr:polymerase [Barur virus]